ncbi:MAG TPA: hypothetical protein VGZ71_08355 [Puia sp.]|nr:hypothetical protein [Puia sp.]
MGFAKKILFTMGLVPLIFFCCKSVRSDKLSPSLKLILLSHMGKIDSSLVLDSFKVIKLDTIYEKQGRGLDLFFYKREFNRIQDQLNSAIAGEKTDSIPFYKYEINYMSWEIDSLETLIAKSDTTHGLGILIHSLYKIRKGNLSLTDTMYYFLDNKMKIANPWMIDSIISRSLVRLKG